MKPYITQYNCFPYLLKLNNDKLLTFPRCVLHNSTLLSTAISYNKQVYQEWLIGSNPCTIEM